MMNVTLKQALPMHLAAIALVFVIGTGVSTAQVQLNLQPGVQLSWLEKYQRYLPPPMVLQPGHNMDRPRGGGGQWPDKHVF